MQEVLEACPLRRAVNTISKPRIWNCDASTVSLENWLTFQIYSVRTPFHSFDPTSPRRAECINLVLRRWRLIDIRHRGKCDRSFGLVADFTSQRTSITTLQMGR